MEKELHEQNFISQTENNNVKTEEDIEKEKKLSMIALNYEMGQEKLIKYEEENYIDQVRNQNHHQHHDFRTNSQTIIKEESQSEYNNNNNNIDINGRKPMDDLDALESMYAPLKQCNKLFESLVQMKRNLFY